MGKRGPQAGTAKRAAPTGIRFDPELKARLEQSAKAAGHSFAEEVSARLRASYTAIDFGNPETLGLAYAIGLALEVEVEKTGFHWFQDPWAFKRATAAINEVLSYFEPGGDPDIVPTETKVLQRLRSMGIESLVEVAAEELKEHDRGRLSGTTAVAMLEAVAAGKSSVSRLAELRPIAAVVKEMLDRLDGAGGAIKDLAKPVLRVIGELPDPLTREASDDK